MAHRLLFAAIGNDLNLCFADVTHTLSATLVTSATMTFSVVFSGTSTTVSGQIWPSSLTLVNAETALWVGPIVNSLMLTENGAYQAVVTIDAAVGQRGFWRLPMKAIVREE